MSNSYFHLPTIPKPNISRLPKKPNSQFRNILPSLHPIIATPSRSSTLTENSPTNPSPRYSTARRETPVIVPAGPERILQPRRPLLEGVVQKRRGTKVAEPSCKTRKQDGGRSFPSFSSVFMTFERRERDARNGPTSFRMACSRSTRREGSRSRIVVLQPLSAIAG